MISVRNLQLTYTQGKWYTSNNQKQAAKKRYQIKLGQNWPFRQWKEEKEAGASELLQETDKKNLNARRSKIPIQVHFPEIKFQIFHIPSKRFQK